jgi:hypothetical protein
MEKIAMDIDRRLHDRDAENTFRRRMWMLIGFSVLTSAFLIVYLISYVKG